MSTTFDLPPLTLARVDDGRGHALKYYFRPAEQPRTSPLLVVFHGWTGYFNEPADYYKTYYPIDPGWNVLFPQGRFGLGRGGSWWLGEHGDFFMVDLIYRMVSETWQRHQINPARLYTWGSSMGGFGAILHGLLAGARAVCVSVPQVCLLGNTWNGFSRPYMEFVFGTDVTERTLDAGPGLPHVDVPEPVKLFHDATNFLDDDQPARNPFFLIAQSRFDMYPGYFEEHGGHLVSKLLKAGVNFRLDVLPEQSHRPIWSCQRATELFAEHAAVIDTPVTFSDQMHRDKQKAFGSVADYLRQYPGEENALVARPYSGRS